MQPSNPQQPTGRYYSKEPTVAKTITLPDENKDTLNLLLAALLALAAAGLLDAPEGWQQGDAEASDEEETEEDDASDDEAEEEEEEEEKPAKSKKGKKPPVTEPEEEEGDEAEEEDSEESDEEEAEEDSEEAEVDKEAVRAILKKLVKKDRAAAVALLKKFKAKTLDDVDEDAYPKVIAAIKKALKG